jgi:hypothetical protein
MQTGRDPVFYEADGERRTEASRFADTRFSVGAVMQIIIPTRGRIHRQTTLQSLPSELLKQTILVCPKREASGLYRLYKDAGVDVVVEPHPDMKIAQTREWVVQTWFNAGYTKIIMLDDDLRFATRISPDGWHLQEITGDELIPEFERLEQKLGAAYPHVGFGVRQGNHLAEAGWKIPGRMCHSLAYYLPIVAKEAKFDTVEIREDFCMTLQLLLKGYPNAVWNETVVDQNGYDAAGGCSTYRTVEMSDAEAWKLKRRFPGFVSLRKPNYKTSVRRLEVTVQWKKALRDGQRNRSRLFVC